METRADALETKLAVAQKEVESLRQQDRDNQDEVRGRRPPIYVSRRLIGIAPLLEQTPLHLPTTKCPTHQNVHEFCQMQPNVCCARPLFFDARSLFPAFSITDSFQSRSRVSMVDVCCDRGDRKVVMDAWWVSITYNLDN